MPPLIAATIAIFITKSNMYTIYTADTSFVISSRTVSTEALQVLAGDMLWDLQARRVMIAYKVQTGLALNREEHLMDEWLRRWYGSDSGRTTYGFI